MATLESKLRVSLIDDLTSKSRHIWSALDKLERKAASIGNPLRSIGGQILAFGATYLGVTEGMDRTYGAAADAQSALTEIGIKANLSATRLAQMEKRLTSLSPQVNQFTSELRTGVDTMLTMGASVDQAEGAIPAIGKTATATGAAIADLSAASVSAMQNLSVMPAEITKMLEGMASAGNAGAFELKDMASYFPQLTASAKFLGLRGVSGINDMAAALQIARRGAGDASTAANNLSDFMGKIVTPQTIKNFKKFGVDVTKELAKANKNGISPIEHFIRILDDKTKGGKGELLTQIFGDKQTLDFIRPMISDFGDYLKIRDEANRANNVVADAYARRMEDANQKTKAVSISLANLGKSIGGKLLGPVGEAADYLSNVLNTLDSRVTVFDRMRLAAEGFANGFGGAGLGGLATEFQEFIFGVENGSDAADQAGRIFARFQEWGESVRSLTSALAENPIAQFFADIAPYGFQILLWGTGIAFLAGTIRKLASAMMLLSGASTIIAAFKTIRSIAGIFGETAKPSGSTTEAPKSTPKVSGGRPGTSGPWGTVPSDAPTYRSNQTGPKIPLKSMPVMPSWGGVIKNGVISGLATWLGETAIRQGFKSVYGDQYREAPGLSESLSGTWKAWSDLIGSGGDKYSGDAAAARSEQNSANVLGPATVRIDAASVAEMTAGTQDVHVTNPQPPNIYLTLSQTITGITDPKAAGDAAMARAGQTARDAVQASYSD